MTDWTLCYAAWIVVGLALAVWRGTRNDDLLIRDLPVVALAGVFWPALVVVDLWVRFRLSGDTVLIRRRNRDY